MVKKKIVLILMLLALLIALCFMGAPAAFAAGSTHWYFAEGYTAPGFDTWLTLQNPGAAAVTATITYMYRDGTTKNTAKYLAANSRETIYVNADAGTGKEVSIRVVATGEIIAERPMYFNYKGVWHGGHNTIGATATSTHWYFAEGYTGTGFETWLTLQNPNAAATTATITYMYRDGTTKTTTKTLPAESRETVDVNADAGHGKELSIQVVAPTAIVAERPMYFSYKGIYRGGHNTIGATAASTAWYFAEGYTGSGFDTWLSLQNHNAAATTATITYMYRDGTTKTTTKEIAANSRETIDVNTDAGHGKELSIQVTAPVAIIAERPMYFNYQMWPHTGTFCNGGTNTIGTTAAYQNWYFAEGCTDPGFDTWLTLQNPHAAATTATITYMYRDGTTKTTTQPIAANSRETIYVNADAGTGKEVSTRVVAPVAIVAERPSYFNYQHKWAGGHDSIGFGTP